MRILLESLPLPYLHCDATASHYLKVLLDAVFQSDSFLNEIIWKRTSGKSDYSQGAKHFPRLHDVILLFRKRSNAIFNPLFAEHDPEYVKSKYPHVDADGRRYDLWDMSGPGGAAKGNPHYEILGVTRYWRYSKERMERMLSEGRVIQPRPSVPGLK